MLIKAIFSVPVFLWIIYSVRKSRRLKQEKILRDIKDAEDERLSEIRIIESKLWRCYFRWKTEHPEAPLSHPYQQQFFKEAVRLLEETIAIRDDPESRTLLRTVKELQAGLVPLPDHCLLTFGPRHHAETPVA